MKSLTTVDAAKRDGLADGRYGLVEVKLGGDKLTKEGVDALNSRNVIRTDSAA